MSFCYPEGNFGRNQLLDGSISLSPLYPNLTIDLQSDRYEPPPEFPLASPYSGIVHHLSGPNTHALTADPSQKVWSGRRCSTIRGPNFHFHYAHGFSTRTLAGRVGLLGPCFKTGRLKPLRQHPKRVTWAEAPTLRCALSSSIPPLAFDRRL